MTTNKRVGFQDVLGEITDGYDQALWRTVQVHDLKRRGRSGNYDYSIDTK